eukprot:6180633-Pleurochrysis_carterae.AAC.5
MPDPFPAHLRVHPSTSIPLGIFVQSRIGGLRESLRVSRSMCAQCGHPQTCGHLQTCRVHRLVLWFRRYLGELVGNSPMSVLLAMCYSHWTSRNARIVHLALGVSAACIDTFWSNSAATPASANLRSSTSSDPHRRFCYVREC